MENDTYNAAPLKVAFVANSSWYLYNLRLGVIHALESAGGYEILLIAPHDKYSRKLREKGYRLIPVKLKNQGLNPVDDLKFLLTLKRIFQKNRPDLVFNYTVKPNIYGSIAAKLAGISSVSIISGLGYSFHQKNWLYYLVSNLYRIALRINNATWFVNKDDRELFLQAGIVKEEKTFLLPGEGINSDHFSSNHFSEGTRWNGHVRFLLSGRLLWEKGVGIYVEAARKIKQQYPDTVFNILGFLDVENPGTITYEQMGKWIDEGVIQYLGETEDVRPQLYHTDCFVLPSFYGEGMPRSLLEAASMELPIITTNNTGCRDVVEEGVNGLICQPNNVEDLTKKLEEFLQLSWEERERLGANGRAKVIEAYHERFLIMHYLKFLSGFFNENLTPLMSDGLKMANAYERLQG